MTSPLNQDLEDFLKQLRSVSDATQLAQGFNSQPQLMLEAFKILTQNYEISSERENELHNVNRRVRELEQAASSGNQRRQSSTNELLLKLTEALALRPQPATKSPLIPDSPLFTGNKQDFLTWKSSVLLKLNVNADHFPNEQSKMAYIYSRLNAQSQSHLQSWLLNGELKFPSVEQMLKLLETLFDDPNRARDAAVRLHSNYQRNQSFVTWIAEIRRDAAIAGYDPESLALRNLILFNMSIELKRAIIYERDIDQLSINETVSRLQDIDNRQRALSSLVSRNSNTNSVRPHVLPRPSIPIITQNNDAMDLSATSSQRKGPLTQEEKDRRRKLGLCLYCGEKGHLIKNCSIRPQQIVRLSEINEEESNEESGKAGAL